MTRIHCFQHVPFETPARIAEWAAEHRYPVTTSHLYEGAAPPPPAEYDWLVVMGGPMNVREEKAYPWMTAELGAIESAIGDGKTVVGVCLGAQLVAHVLGARVKTNPVREIGWYTVALTGAAEGHPLTADLPESFTAFHWHCDTFDVPSGAVHLARSEACAHQMFAVGSRILGVQFHLEMTPAGIAALAENCAGELTDAPYIQTREEIETECANVPDCHDMLDSILARL